jgi:DNA-binding transcriptional ArsR family regulator
MSGKAGPDGEQPAPDSAVPDTAARDNGAPENGARDSPAPDRPGQDIALMRAMAHPARLALMAHLGHAGPATATECAGVVDLSPSAVSYHLRALAKAGLVEEAPGRGDGRERRWRRTAERYESGGADPGPDALAALRGLLESIRSWDDARFRQFLTQLGDESAEWRGAACFLDATLLVTAEELRAVGTATQELLAPYRMSARADPPDGARTVYSMFRGFPAEQA